jgi:hypothetical protein
LIKTQSEHYFLIFKNPAAIVIGATINIEKGFD